MLQIVRILLVSANELWSSAKITHNRISSTRFPIVMFSKAPTVSPASEAIISVAPVSKEDSGTTAMALVMNMTRGALSDQNVQTPMGTKIRRQLSHNENIFFQTAFFTCGDSVGCERVLFSKGERSRELRLASEPAASEKVRCLLPPSIRGYMYTACKDIFPTKHNHETNYIRNDHNDENIIICLLSASK